jgi:hypothetical protein
MFSDLTHFSVSMIVPLAVHNLFELQNFRL